jgi:DNA-binding beta-propeller fold protein YncE
MRCKAGMLGQNRAKAWELPSVRYVQSFSVAAQTANVQDVAFGNSGLSMYVTREDGYVYQYTLSTAWDVSTASYTNFLNTSTQGSGLGGVAFKSDGTKLFVASNNSNLFQGQIFEYAIGTAWNISTATYTQQFTPLGATGTSRLPHSLAFSADGFSMFVADGNAAEVRQYALSTAWNISTASFAGSLSVSAEEGSIKGAAIGDGGRQLYVVGFQNDRVRQYRLSTPYDVSTAVPANAFDVRIQDGISVEGLPSGLFFKDDGLAMFVSGDQADAIHQYTLV